MITYEVHETLSHILTKEGAEISLQGSHESRVWAAVPAKGEGAPMTVPELKAAIGNESASVGQGRAFKSKWIGKEGNGFIKLVCPRPVYVSVNLYNFQVSSIEDTTQLELREVDSTGTVKAGEKSLADLRKRKLITQKYFQRFDRCLRY